MSVDLLQYRPYRGAIRPAWTTIWPIARTALGLLIRRRLFWGLYARQFADLLDVLFWLTAVGMGGSSSCFRAGGSRNV